MYTLKKLSLYIFIILLLISIYQDLILNRTTIIPDNDAVPADYHEGYMIAHFKVLPGDTVLSITESLNSKNTKQLDIQKIMNDFKELNPTTDPLNLKPYTEYYFPVYHD
ncbi:hypothetical protein [Oceanobacillus damuensis]|uniref:hypothetical protein n=1 Tax=Oceanobacillus damuensis TaxID=937928 RepID=UPI00083736F4|nr:hypothetical protein [Oceanobacillus damuensis]